MLIFSISDRNKVLKEHKKILSKCNYLCKQAIKILKIKKKYIFDCNVVNQREMIKLNKKYHKKNNATNVLSFALNDAKTLKTNLLGEIYICYEVCINEAKIKSIRFIDYFSFLFIHGLLHLFGYTHSTNKNWNLMTKLTNKILKCKYNHEK